MTDQTETKTDETKPEGEKLYAGKYKTPEEMEEAIIGKDKEYGKLRQSHEELKKTVDSLKTVPESYNLPEGSDVIKDQIAALQEMAKTAELPQEKFEKLVKERINRYHDEERSKAERLKEIGSENIIVLEDYVKKAYPEALQKAVLTQLLSDKEAREQALKHREKILNNRAPGMDNGNPGATGNKEAYDGQKELTKLAREVEANKHDRKLRDKLIETAREVGEARFGKR